MFANRMLTQLFENPDRELGALYDMVRENYSSISEDEDRELISLVNNHSIIARIRIMSCFSAGESEVLAQNLESKRLNIKRDDNEDIEANRKINASFMLDESQKNTYLRDESRLAHITTQLRAGVTAKGEVREINPGLEGKLVWDTKQASGIADLWSKTPKDDIPASRGGSFRFFSIKSESNIGRKILRVKDLLRLLDGQRNLSSEDSTVLEAKQLLADSDLINYGEDKDNKQLSAEHPVKQREVITLIQELNDMVSVATQPTSNPDP